GASKCPVSTAVTPAADQTVCQGVATNQLTATITTSGTNGNPSFQYQWYYNTTNSNTVAGATAVGTNSSTFTPLSTAAEVGTRYYFVVGYANNNGCGQSATDQSLASNTVKVTVNPAPTVTSTASPAASVCPGTDVTYTTQSGQSNYVWTVPGVLNTDYTITSGGISSTNNTVTLKWLTSGNKAITVNNKDAN